MIGISSIPAFDLPPIWMIGTAAFLPLLRPAVLAARGNSSLRVLTSISAVIVLGSAKCNAATACIKGQDRDAIARSSVPPRDEDRRNQRPSACRLPVHVTAGRERHPQGHNRVDARGSRRTTTPGARWRSSRSARTWFVTEIADLSRAIEPGGRRHPRSTAMCRWLAADGSRRPSAPAGGPPFREMRDGTH